MADQSIIDTINQSVMSSKNWEQLLEKIPVALVLVNAADYRFLYINHPARMLYDVDDTPAGLEAARTQVKLLTPDGTPFPCAELPVVGVLKTGKEVNNVELLIEGVKGKRRPVRLNATPLADSAGKIILVIFSFEDLTEQKQAEKALKESEARYRSLFENSLDAIMLTRPDGSILSANPAACRMLGMTEEEILRANREGLVVQDEGLQSVLQERARQGQACYEIILRRKDGSIFPCEGTSSLFTDADGTIKISMILRDISARKRNEANLAFLASLAEDFSRLTSADEIMQAVGEKTGKYLGITNCLFAEIDEAADKVNVIFDWSAVNMPSVTGSYQLSAFVTGEFLQAARSGITIIIRNTQTDPRTDAARYSALNILASVTVPFFRSGRWKYLFTVNDSSPRDWQQDEIELIREITNRTFPRLERARAEEQALFPANLLAQVHEAVVGMDCSYTITYWNKGAEKVFGWKAEEVLGKNTKDLFQGLIDEPACGVQQARLDAQGPVQGEVKYKHKGGASIICEVTRSTLKNTKGEITGFVSTLHDITERKQAEAALRASEQRYRTLFDSIDEGFCIIEVIFAAREKPVDYRFLEINPAFEQHTGLRNAVGRTVRELVPEHEEYWFQIFGEIALTGKPRRFEYPARALNRYYNVDAFKIGESESRKVAVLFRDISVIKNAEKELLEERARLQAIIDSMPVGLWVADWDGKIVLVNEIAKQIWGGAAPTASRVGEYGVYKAWWVGTGKLIEPEEMPLARALKGETCKEEVIDFERFDGKRGTQLVSSAPIRDAEGRIIGGVAVVQDITKQKQLEQSLREADRQKNQFLAVLSHELRNPLAAIRNSLTILDRVTPGSEQAKRGKAIIERQTSQLTHLVDDLLDVSRITQNKIVLQKERLELNGLLEQVVEDYKTMLEEHKLHFRLERTTGPVYVQGDQVRLSQIFSNLLQNAIKFTPLAGSITITVVLQPAGKHVEVRVADTGIGITPEMLPQLFKPFVQSSMSLDRQGVGLGLGLALVKGLAELHGGQVSAASSGPGKGAEFIVRLPLAETTRAEASAVSGTGSQRGRKILIIDDNIDLVESLQELLEMDGHTVAVAYNGPEGLARAREFRPEIILCDIGLPGMDGYAVAGEIRRDEQLKAVFLVALTGYAAPEDLKQAQATGFNQHLKKPIDIAALEKAILRATDQ